MGGHRFCNCNTHCLVRMNKWLESFAYKTSLSWWIF